jgi:outer membrane protein OmpA-like peptidoglycan-associated protein
MNAARLLAVLAACAAVAWGCGPTRVQTIDPQPQPRATVVLLPDPEGGTVGRALVTNAGTTVDLAAAGDSTVVSATQPPSPIARMADAEIDRLFSDLLAALPFAPRHFTLHFRFESDELTAESRLLVPQVLEAAMSTPAPDVIVVGHTDTMGAPTRNVELGLKRAGTVLGLLVAAGLDPSLVDVTSHGEADPLVPTPDERLEPRNRRVEITVR